MSTPAQLSDLVIGLQITQTLATVVLGGAGAFIAWQQKRLADIRLRHDLFDRRYAVYTACRILIVEILQDAKVSLPQIKEFTRCTSDASFVLDAAIAGYMEELRLKALRLWVHHTKRNPLDAKVQLDAQSEHDLLLWFNKQTDILVETFQPYLQLEQNPRLIARRLCR